MRLHLDRDNLVMLGILAVVGAAYVAVVHRWQSRSMEQVQARSAQLRRQLEAESGKAMRVPPMVREIEALKQHYGNWDRRLPQRKELAGFLREIGANLESERLSRPAIMPGDPTRGPLYNRLPIKMKFEGDFLALGGFLRRVDGMTRLTRVDELVIQPKPEGDSLAVEMGMNIYFTEQ